MNMPPILLAAFYMSGAIVSFTSMAIAGRAVRQEFDTFEIMMYRSILGIIIVIAVAGYAGTLNQITRNRLSLQFLRNLFHFTGQNLWFYALPIIPLGQLFALEFTSPLWVILLAPFFLGERLTPVRAFAAALGFIGVMLVARPDTGGLSIGILAAALAAIAFAGTTICTKVLTGTERITSILFYLTLMQAIFGIVCAGFDGDIKLPTADATPWLFLIGCAGLLAHFCMTKALSVAPAVVVIPFDFARLPVIVIIGVLFYNEPLEYVALLGALIILTANYLNIRAEGRR